MKKPSRREFLKWTAATLGLGGYARLAKAQSPPNAASTELAQPLPFVPGSWTWVVLPDTQNYSKKYPGLFHLQTQWIAENKDKHNITYVLTLGDLTNDNNQQQWERVSRALGKLDAVVPYTIVLGNHDYSPDGKTRNTLVNNYFPPSKFANWPSFGGVMEKGLIENNYHVFNMAGQDWLLLNLEWGPRDKALQWANQILAKYPKHKAVIATHAYLYSDSTRYDWAKKSRGQKWNPHNYATAGGVNDGEQIWQKLAKKHANVFMVINGHVLNDGLGFLISKGAHGNTVNQMLVNFQSPIHSIGGDAWLRLLEFSPDGKTIQAKTYSPLYERYKTDPDNQFVIRISD
ncbi:MAG: metallophosphoesterase [Planctomycetes bacterium]|nr:metallophosphoesterase [Planctomycetota bacterium]